MRRGISIWFLFATLGLLALVGCGVLIPDLPPPRELSRAEAEPMMAARQARMSEEYKRWVEPPPTSLPLKFDQRYRTKVPLWTYWSNEGVLLTFGRWKLYGCNTAASPKPDYPAGSTFRLSRVLAIWGDGSECSYVYVKFEGSSSDYVINVDGEWNFFLNPKMFEVVDDPVPAR